MVNLDRNNACSITHYYSVNRSDCTVRQPTYMYANENCKLSYQLKDKDYCPIEIIKGLTDKGQFQYLTKLMGPQEGTYLYAAQFHSLR